MIITKLFNNVNIALRTEVIRHVVVHVVIVHVTKLGVNVTGYAVTSIIERDRESKKMLITVL